MKRTQGVVLILFNDSNFDSRDENAVLAEVPHLELPFDEIIFLCPQRPGLLGSGTVSVEVSLDDMIEACDHVMVVYNFQVKPFILLEWAASFQRFQKRFRVLYKFSAAPSAPSDQPACVQAALDPLPF